MQLDKEHKISVMLPIYGVEKFVERCFLSVLNQTMQQGVEMIIVNDATPDKSMEIIHKLLAEYAPKCEMTFKIIEHEVNKGLAAARITAMSYATGEYTIHIDSDDYMEPNMLEKMYAKAIETSADMVVADCWLEWENTSKYQKEYNSHQQFLKEVICAKRSSLWNKLIKRSLYLDNNITWKEGIDLREDYIVTLPLCFSAKSIVYLPQAFYHYVQYNPASISRDNAYKERMKCILYSAQHLINFIKEKQITGYDKEVAFMLLQVKVNCMAHTFDKNWREYSTLYPEANEYKSMFIGSSNSLKVKFQRYCLLNEQYVLYSIYNRLVGVVKSVVNLHK